MWQSVFLFHMLMWEYHRSEEWVLLSFHYFTSIWSYLSCKISSSMILHLPVFAQVTVVKDPDQWIMPSISSTPCNELKITFALSHVGEVSVRASGHRAALFPHGCAGTLNHPADVLLLKVTAVYKGGGLSCGEEIESATSRNCICLSIDAFSKLEYNWSQFVPVTVFKWDTLHRLIRQKLEVLQQTSCIL